MAETATKDLGGSIFWILIIMLSLGGLTFLALWAYFNNSVKGAIMAFIFFAMVVSGILLSKFEIFNAGTWSQSCFAFVLGNILWLIIGGSKQSVASLSLLSVSKNSLLATIASELPEILEFVMNAFVIPIAEETFWLIGIPFATITMLNVASKGKVFGIDLSFLKNIIVQIIIIALITGISFAGFHIGKLFIAFLIAAFIFRTIMIVLVVGDTKFGLIPGLSLVPAFAIGAHIGNNWGSEGFVRGISLLAGNFWPIGLIVFVLLAAIYLSALNQIVLWVIGAKGTVIGESA